MKKISLKDVSIKMRQIKGENMIILSETSTYQDLMITVLNRPLEGGSIDEQRKVCAVMDKVDAAQDFLILEEAEWQILKVRAEKFSWGVISQEIVKFVDAISKAEDATIALVKESA